MNDLQENVRFRPEADITQINYVRVMAENLLTEGREWLQQVISAPPLERAMLIISGADLARRIRSKSVDMQYSKATEFCSDVQLLSVLAAKVALLSGLSELASYEADVYYYKAFDSTKKYVEEYDEFKRVIDK